MSERWVILGRIGAPYGVKGWFHVQSFTAVPETILSYSKWHVSTPKQAGQLFEVREHRKHGKGLVAWLEGIDSREAAALLTGAEIAVSREVLPDLAEEEFYWTDLEGLEVYDPQGQCLGKVAYFYEAGASEVMVVRGKSERHIPFTMGQVVKSVDLSTAKLVVDWEFD